jgi:hypothetical protein
MSHVTIDVFISSESNPDDRALMDLLEQVENEFDGDIELVYHKEQDKLFNEYNITATPALVIDEMIKIIGFCPSKESVLFAIRGGALD